MAIDVAFPVPGGPDFPDWIELYNPGDEAVSLGGLYITDDPERPTRHPLSDALVIGPHSHHLLYADARLELGPAHLDFKLDGDGESVLLVAEDGVTVIDAVTFPAQTSDRSLGRLPDGEGPWFTLGEPSPFAPNAGPAVLPPPSVSPAAGRRPPGTVVTVTGSLDAPGAPDITLRYTLDGRTPDAETGQTWDGSLELVSTTVLRVAAVADGWLDSPVVTRTWLVDEPSTVPVVSIVAPPDLLFGPDLPGPLADTTYGAGKPEVAVHLEVFDGDALVLAQRAGARRHGSPPETGSGEPDALQKSLSLSARQDYGAAWFDWAAFPDAPWTAYKRLVLRSGSHDSLTWPRVGAHLRDALMHQLARDSDTGWLAWRPVTVLVNGAYHGLYNLRERPSRHYVERRYGVPDDEVLTSEASGAFFTPDLPPHPLPGLDAVTDALATLDPASPEALAALEAAVDVASLIDYALVELFSGNFDWPHNNVEMWRPAADGGRIAWVLKDGDGGFTLDNGITHNPIALAIRTPGELLPEGDPPNTYRWTHWGRLMGLALELPAVRHRFIDRYADLLATALAAPAARARFDTMVAAIEPEVPRHIDRWVVSRAGGDPTTWTDTWAQEVEGIRAYLESRPDTARAEVVDYFPEVDGVVSVTLTADPGGAVALGTLAPAAERTVQRFSGVPVRLEALPSPGSVFAGWSDAALPPEPAIAVVFSGDAALHASFATVPGLAVVPGQAVVPAGGALTFAVVAVGPDGATVTDPQVTWSVDPALGAIDGEGRLTVLGPVGDYPDAVEVTWSGETGHASVTVAPAAPSGGCGLARPGPPVPGVLLALLLLVLAVVARRRAPATPRCP